MWEQVKVQAVHTLLRGRACWRAAQTRPGSRLQPWVPGSLILSHSWGKKFWLADFHIPSYINHLIFIHYHYYYHLLSISKSVKAICRASSNSLHLINVDDHKADCALKWYSTSAASPSSFPGFLLTHSSTDRIRVFSDLVKILGLA